MGKIENRRQLSNERLQQLKGRLTTAKTLIENKACVYATGSFARGEASNHSDLDLFIAGKTQGDDRMLSRLDEICVKAELIQANKNLNIQEFSGDGEYLVHYTVTQLVGSLGAPHDDANNTFTARLLLLLESAPLLGESTYREVIDDVIAAYWRDYPDHKTEFVPAFLANDILRLWRTFCVNYEARTSEDSDEKKAKRRLKNYKLKHSRMLTCYSGLLDLLAVYARVQTVTPEDVRAMTMLTPTQRLEALKVRNGLLAPKVDDLLNKYAAFLGHTDANEPTMIEQFKDNNFARARISEASTFGEAMFTLLEAVGQGAGQRFYRLLVV
jgi:predicted nucleotidyltransferase